MSSLGGTRPIASPPLWRPWAYMLLASVLLVAVFHEGLREMVRGWSGREEYSHGFVLPFVAAFLVWQKKPLLQTLPFTGSWVGAFLVCAGLALYVAGELSTLFIVVQYAFLIVLAGLLLAFLGRRAFASIFAPLLVLVFMVPLPDFLLQALSGRLQLVSSELGVWIIRLFNISVFLEGNVIDLGTYKLQVVEACSGLRYLFPLMALAFIAAYLFRGAPWKRALIFLSSIPVTVLMNSFRIGVIGVLVDRFGVSMAEGFIHDFEGWAIFMACTGVLIVEMWALAAVGKDAVPLRQAFRLDDAAPAASLPHPRSPRPPRAFLVAMAALAIVAILGFALPQRVDASVERKSFFEFPLQLGGWRATPKRMDPGELDALKLDDYILADFAGADGRAVNLYVAYYNSQRKGESAHSPRSCIPGGGWEITQLAQHVVGGVRIAGQPLRVNRVVVEKGDSKQLVYYWFQQRGRIITNEYAVKWYILWDALTRNRTDGALVRLVTYVGPDQTLARADAKLAAFAMTTAPTFESYIPD
jgi:exosortase D (VPLPA-CTERM-specific)